MKGLDVKRAWLVSGILLVCILVGCRNQEFASPIPTEPATVLQLVELAADPDENEKKFVQVGGRYGQLPVPPCDEALHLPPASWSLSDGGVVVRAAGLENIVRSLAQDGGILIVEGRWMRWHGLVGCGNSAVSSTIWYLDVMRILSPNPLMLVSTSPSSAMPDSGLDLSPTAGSIGESLVTFDPTSGPGVATGTPTYTRAAATGTVAATLIPSPAPISTGSVSPLATPTGPSSPLATPDGRLPTLSAPASPTLIPSGTVLPTFTPLHTATPTPTPDATGTDLPTFTPAPTSTSTPTPSPTSDTSLVYKGQLGTEEDQVENGTLSADQGHYWLLTASAGDVITVTCGPASGVDIELTVNNPQGTKIAGRDYTGAGGAETIPGLVLDLAGDYQIVVDEVDGLAGDYGIVVLDHDATHIRFTGNLGYDDGRTTTLPANTYHLWHFQGTAGDNITIRLTPGGGSDLVFQFYGPDMGSRIERVDMNPSGGVEEADFTLTETGFYTVWIEDWDFEEAAYELLVTDS